MIIVDLLNSHQITEYNMLQNFCIQYYKYLDAQVASIVPAYSLSSSLESK